MDDAVHRVAVGLLLLVASTFTACGDVELPSRTPELPTDSVNLVPADLDCSEEHIITLPAAECQDVIQVAARAIPPDSPRPLRARLTQYQFCPPGVSCPAPSDLEIAGIESVSGAGFAAGVVFEFDGGMEVVVNVAKDATGRLVPTLWCKSGVITRC